MDFAKFVFQTVLVTRDKRFEFIENENVGNMQKILDYYTTIMYKSMNFFFFFDEWSISLLLLESDFSDYRKLLRKISSKT